MAQHDYDIANAPGAVVRADINSVLEAIGSINSGPTAPPVTFPHMLWFDESANALKKRNSANTAWDHARMRPGPPIVIGTSTTWAKPNNLAAINIKGVGGGGAGGGAAATGSNEVSVGGGGASGSPGEAFIWSSEIDANTSVTIGAGGAPSSGQNGGAGTQTSFGAHLICPGGNGGIRHGPVSNSQSSLGVGGAPGSASSGSSNHLTVPGEPGDFGVAGVGNLAIAGNGAASIFSGGGRFSQPGSRGAGGGGVSNTANQAAIAGASGGNGLIIIYPWFYY